METETQAVMFADVHLWRPQPAEPEAEAQAPAGERQPRFQPVNRNQLLLRPVDVEQLVGPDHPARAIWALVNERDLGRFHDHIQAVEGVAGRSARDPRLLISLWIYAYLDGTPSAREIARQCLYNPAYQWLTGANSVSAHALSDFRTAHAEALKDLSTQVLALLAEEGLVDLEQVTQDGTKVRASAGADTFRREATIQRHLEQARQRLEELDRQDGEELSALTLEARQRAAREKIQRMEQALQQMEQIRRTKPESEQAQVRVSLTDPEARIMKQNDGGFAPSYNVQFTTDAKQTVIVSVEVTQEASDAGQLQPAMERLQQEAGQAPRQALVDGGYTSRENVVGMARREIDLIGPPLDGHKQKETLYEMRGVAPEFRPEAFVWDPAANRYTCPAGKRLPFKSQQALVGQTKYTYWAAVEDCAACAHKPLCCPTSKGGRALVRTEDGPEMVAFRTKMETAEAKQIYKKRGQVAEFPNLCVKQKFGLRQFSVRGLKKVNIEALWVNLAFNVQQWIRLCWRPQLAMPG